MQRVLHEHTTYGRANPSDNPAEEHDEPFSPIDLTRRSDGRRPAVHAAEYTRRGGCITRDTVVKKRALENSFCSAMNYNVLV